MKGVLDQKNRKFCLNAIGGDQRFFVVLILAELLLKRQIVRKQIIGKLLFQRELVSGKSLDLLQRFFQRFSIVGGRGDMSECDRIIRDSIGRGIF